MRAAYRLSAPFNPSLLIGSGGTQRADDCRSGRVHGADSQHPPLIVVVTRKKISSRNCNVSPSNDDRDTFEADFVAVDLNRQAVTLVECTLPG